MAIIYEVNNVVQNVLLPSMVLIANAMSVTLILALLLRVDAVLATSAAAVLGMAVRRGVPRWQALCRGDR